MYLDQIRYKVKVQFSSVQFMFMTSRKQQRCSCDREPKLASGAPAARAEGAAAGGPPLHHATKTAPSISNPTNLLGTDWNRGRRSRVHVAVDARGKRRTRGQARRLVAKIRLHAPYGRSLDSAERDNPLRRAGKESASMPRSGGAGAMGKRGDRNGRSERQRPIDR